MFKIKNFVEAEKFLAIHIPKSSSQTFPGELGLKRAEYFLHLLGDPQEKMKVIHVAGTSGKGSTCYLISSLLASQGFKVGLHQSPHLTDVTERFQISAQTISQKEFIFYLNKIISVINLVSKTFHGPLTYFEILVGLAFYIFADRRVDYAVMETGLGGWYDGTNVVSRSDKLAVLTKIGLDHTNILGKTIEKIALQKAMIINENSQAISIEQDKKAEKIIRQVAKEKHAKLLFVSSLSSPRRRGSSLSITSSKGDFSLDSRLRGNDSIKSLINNLGLIGNYQKENASLALAVVNYLSQRDGFLINKNKIKKTLSGAKFPGRFDIRKIKNKTVIFDGAHNPQKMKAFINALIRKYPNKKINFLLAFKKGKDFQEMLKIVVPWADSIILTSFFTEDQDMINQSVNPTEIGNQLNWFVGVDPRVDPPYQIIPDLKKAWEIVLNKKEPIVVTGSLYLIGEIYKLIIGN